MQVIFRALQSVIHQTNIVIFTVTLAYIKLCGSDTWRKLVVVVSY
ncbi:hypothetical protein RG47T_0630 [Mucilaginibacter polytrichastri]|uniref:Uncharacterized protein n=1 Tax=Mucilaginibacter polytrichastri TaxID=1302689 RepID=A0A1Q5ZTV1_9SPHI|nr:hypothetical protein RG47T_0630 [Mucilaginibacter polytrichastri]